MIDFIMVAMIYFVIDIDRNQSNLSQTFGIAPYSVWLARLPKYPLYLETMPNSWFLEGKMISESGTILMQERCRQALDVDPAKIVFTCVHFRLGKACITQLIQDLYIENGSDFNHIRRVIVSDDKGVNATI